MSNLDQLLTIAALAAATLVLSTATAIGLRARARRVAFAGQRYRIRGPLGAGSAEQLFASLHGLLRPPLRRLFEGQPTLAVEIVGHAGEAELVLWIPDAQFPLVESLLRANLPGVELAPYILTISDSPAIAAVSLHQNTLLPLRTDFDVAEPLNSLLWTLGRVQVDETVVVQLVIQPATSGWQGRAHGAAQRLRNGTRTIFQEVVLGLGEKTGPSHLDQKRAEAMEEKAGRLGFECAMRVVAVATSPEREREYLRSVAAGLRPFAGMNSFELRRVLHRGSFLDDFTLCRLPLFGGFLLNTEELAAIWHLPAEAPPHMTVVTSPRLAPPSGVDRGERLLGVSNFADRETPIRLSLPDSRRHLHVLGPTGSGKSVLLTRLALQDLEAGRGLAVLDPKGDVIPALLARMPARRIKDLVLISAEDDGYSVGINPLEVTVGADRELIAENTLTIFKRIYERFWGPRTDDILKSTLLTLMRQPGSTLAHVPLLLTDAGFRRRLLADLDEPFALDGFWRWFNGLSDAQRGEAVGPVLNKLRDFLVRPRLRRLLCQPRSTVDIPSLVDGSGVLLVDLSVGRWGESASSLVGSFLVAKIWQAVLARSGQPEEARPDFFLYLDEFQQFQGIAGPFAEALAQARSLRLNLTIANQHLAQLPRELREAIGSNARSRIVFQSGPDDAAHLAREFAPLTAEALMSLPRFEVAARLSIDGETSRPFTARTLPLSAAAAPSVADVAVEASRQRFARHAAVIDNELRAILSPLQETPIPELGVGRRARR